MASTHFDEIKLGRFLKEFYHKDHDSSVYENIKAIIVMEDKPSKDLLDAIHSYENFTHILIGSIFDERILELADAKNAEDAFIISNQYAKESENVTDVFTILATKVY